MIKVLFFARYREALELDELTLELRPAYSTLADLQQFLINQGGKWEVLNDEGLMCAINQELVSPQSAIVDGDEVAFFPTVTGG